MEYQLELIKELRRTLNLTEDICTDVEILEATEGTYFRAKIEQRFALKNLTNSVKYEMNAIWEKLVGKK